MITISEGCYLKWFWTSQKTYREQPWKKPKTWKYSSWYRRSQWLNLTGVITVSIGKLQIKHRCTGTWWEKKSGNIPSSLMRNITSLSAFIYMEIIYKGESHQILEIASTCCLWLSNKNNLTGQVPKFLRELKLLSLGLLLFRSFMIFFKKIFTSN
jgi:hypothetical protein